MCGRVRVSARVGTAHSQAVTFCVDGLPPVGDARCLSRTLPLERPLGSQRVLGKCPSGPHPMAPHGPPSPGPPPGEEGEQHSPVEGPLGDHRRESLWGGGAAISSVTQETDMSQ